MSAIRTMHRLTISTLLLLHTFATPAAAEIIGLLETPEGFASQVGNVQGWVYTTTPGAELIQPFDVLIDGVKTGEVPCCSERGDVNEGDPSIPLRTGFSGVTNWAREAGRGPITVQVRVRDTMGGEVLLTNANAHNGLERPSPTQAGSHWGTQNGDDDETLVH
ncbi:MAG: hypothetical protein P8R42_08515 [Candidatus Binatia bacterium]|nr:hypothetical protein [Candidatus Binatia bacterium]